MRGAVASFLIPLLLAPRLARADDPDAGAGDPDAGTDAAPPSAPDASTPTATPPPEPSARKPRDAGWEYQYSLARERLRGGEFEEAAKLFRRLAATAADARDQELALSQAELAEARSRPRITYTAEPQSNERHVHTRPTGERTSDEMGVLYVNAAFYGIGTGVWLSTAGQAKSAEVILLPMLAFAGATVGTVAALDARPRFRYGVPQSIVAGLYIGLEEGIAWVGWNQAQRPPTAIPFIDGGSTLTPDTRWSTAANATIIWGSSTLGAIVGGALGSNIVTTPGRASFVHSAALWTSLITGLTAGAVTTTSQDRDKNAFFTAGVGVTAGAIGGLLLAGTVSPSISRVRYIDLGGILGGLAIGGVYSAAAGKEANSQAGCAAFGLGILGGLALAWTVTDSTPADRPEKTTDPKSKPEKSWSRIDWSPGLMPANGGMMFGVHGTGF